MLCDDLEGLGGRSKSKRIYVYIYLIPFIVQQILTQHCKAVKLQLKTNRNTFYCLSEVLHTMKLSILEYILFLGFMGTLFFLFSRHFFLHYSFSVLPTFSHKVKSFSTSFNLFSTIIFLKNLKIMACSLELILKLFSRSLNMTEGALTP